MTSLVYGILIGLALLSACVLVGYLWPTRESKLDKLIQKNVWSDE